MRKLIICILTTAALTLLLAITTYAAPTDDITAPYDVPTTEQLTGALRHDLVPYAADYLAAAERYGVNVYFLTAKDALESGWGRYQAAPNNLGGWTDNTGAYMAFASIPEYINYTARAIRDMYLTDTGQYHEGYTLADVGVHYNGSIEWVEAVGGIWAEIQQHTHEIGGVAQTPYQLSYTPTTAEEVST